MLRLCLHGCIAAVIGLVQPIPAESEPICRPMLAFRNAELSAMQPPAGVRRWTAVVVADASGCAAASTGRFEIVFIRTKETGPDLEFKEWFAWKSSASRVEVDFWADEAVEKYRFGDIEPCPCAD